MDDLADLDWSTANQPSDKRPPFNNTSNYYPSFKATPPVSGRSTPLPDNLLKAQASTAKASPSQSDSFASLLPSFAANQNTKNLSLKEQQARLEEQKRQKSLDQARQWGSLGGDGSGATSSNISRTASPSPAFTQTLGSQINGQKLPLRSTTPLQRNGSNAKLARQDLGSADNILAALNSPAPPERSSQLPGPSHLSSASVNPSSTKNATQQSSDVFSIDDDDPFGLGTTPTYSSTTPVASTTQATKEDDDDVLGLLGKSVSELAQSKAAGSGNSSHPVDTAIAELVDMGFSAEKSKDALARTESGLDVQAAVGYLLSQAHSESRNKSRGPASVSPVTGERQRRRDDDPLEDLPNRQQRAGSQQRVENGQAPTQKDTSKMAAEFGNNFLKTAGSLWKAGQKKVNKAMAEFNAENESSQPKWMRDATAQRSSSHAREETISPTDAMQGALKSPTNAVTDEAALLEMGTGRPKPTRKNKAEPDVGSRHDNRLDEPFQQQKVVPKTPQFAKQDFNNERRPIEMQNSQRLTRQMTEDTVAYVSPARRKKTVAPQQQQVPQPTPSYNKEPLNNSPQGRHGIVSPVPAVRPGPSRPATTIPISSKPKPPPRVIPAISAPAMQASTRNRNAGTAAFKLGNYAEAHTSYTAAFRDIPKQHPLLIILLTNRALTSLKTGDPKQCITDADQALEIIGPSQGKGEFIIIEGEEGKKDMGPYWGKAMMRRAEALEQLERWTDAAKIWKECVEAGVGGVQSVQGRTRCEKASGNHQTSTSVPKRTTSAPPKAKPKPVTRSALDDLSGRPAASTVASSEAVERLRAANSAAAKLDDERFALTDAVADRVEKWKKGKEQNLRALLGSLDTVLWADSGWKKVGMAELLNPSKVKINYMKGIAKVHPDKLPTSASTEQIMISGAVFSTLNEAWDAFKKENGL